MNYQDTDFFAAIIKDYLNEDLVLKPFYNRFSKIENFESQIQEKKNNFNQKNRKILVDELQFQYKNINTSLLTQQNILKLLDDNCYSITTGHQLNLFTGPIYFLYKIITTINLCEELKIKYPDKKFVPIYWMATEDHDIEEINFFNFKNTKMQWKTNQSGAVGDFYTENIENVFNDFCEKIGDSINANYLKKIFKNSYLKHSNLADATRFLVNELFSNKGLIIIDANKKVLKKQFIPYFEKELIQKISYNKVSETNQKLNNYKIQVKPREINLFYLSENKRERIIFENNSYKINNSDKIFNELEILIELNLNPEKFSPNVILRPLYQEVLLPNLCYIGGGGELSYWLQLKSTFDAHQVTFPILAIRNSVLLASQKSLNKMNHLDLTWIDLFKNQQVLIQEQTFKIALDTISFTDLKISLKNQFEKLNIVCNQTHKSFSGALKAQEKKQLNGLDNLEKKFLNAEKKLNSEKINRIIALQDSLFPNKSLQERQKNFSEFYLESGQSFIDKLFLEIKPLENHFSIIV